MYAQADATKLVAFHQNQVKKRDKMINKINLEQTLDRLLAFAEHRLDDGILANISVCDKPSPLSPDGEQAYIKECPLIKERENYFKPIIDYFKNIDPSNLCDSIPCTYPTSAFGESIWSAFYGGNITFAGTKDSTWSHCSESVVKNLNEFTFPELPEDNFWVRKMLETTKYAADKIGASCDFTPFIFYDCLNLLVELRGATDAYMDLYDSPELVTRFMDWSVNANIKIYDAQSNILKDIAGSAMGGHPYKIFSRSCIPDLSIDAYGLCNVETYQNFGLEYHKRIVEHYGGGRLHIHANGRHLCKTVSTIKKLCCCQLTDDIGYPAPWEILEELKDDLYPIPVRIKIPKEIFIRRLNKRELPGGVLYEFSVEKMSEANEIMKKVFDYSPSN